jgi:hypothetical protein
MTGARLDTQPVIIVSGLPRSGTSLMMQMLAAGGIEVLTDSLRTPDENNPRGYYELEAVKFTRTNPQWLAGAPGKAVKIIYRLLYDLPADYSYRVIFMQRDRHEVLASQRAMLQGRSGTATGLSDKQLGDIFAREIAAINQWLAQQPNFSVLNIEYRQLVQNPRERIQAIAAFLSRPMNIQAMQAAIDPALYRQRA